MTEPARPPVLVTGATGFLGGHVVRRLCEEGREVHALCRESSDRSALEGASVEWHRGDLTDAASIERALTGLAGRGPEVIHGAAVISYRTRDAALQQEVNVEGTRRVLLAARAAEASRFVHVSSVVAVGHAPDLFSPLDEDAEYNGADLRCDYATTKRAAEMLALGAHPELDVVVVNPGAIFGPGSESNNTTVFVQEVAKGRLGGFAPPGSLSVVGVEDVADGVLLALERGRPGRRYILTTDNVPLVDLLHRTGVLVGSTRRRRVLPPSLWRFVTGAARVGDRVLASDRVTPQALRLLGVHFAFDSSRAREELGWSPGPFDEVLRRTVEFARERGLLDG